MFISDRPIFKKFWEPFLKHIDRKFSRHEYVHIEGTNVYMMWWRHCRLYVIADYEDDGVFYVIGWYYLYQQKGWAAWEIYQSYIFTDHRGQGWTNVLHDVIVNREGLMLASGPCQTHLARRMWRKMVEKDEYDIWAHDFHNLDSWAPVTYDPENDDLWCRLQIYDIQWNPDRDVRLIAIRKSDDNSLRGSSRSAERHQIPWSVGQASPHSQVLSLSTGR